MIYHSSSTFTIITIYAISGPYLSYCKLLNCNACFSYSGSQHQGVISFEVLPDDQ